ncbi:carbohydrate ABC transporter permease [Cohnella phaseoli]|uniref:Carbohydrate ABC transporter membrane protein 2 (CUT1 family) n=1 Tax=Cohnella phaseoli TaxID=456490 RepID=A0A3D9I6Q9_9BACL|nr:carbohydrate ABC transporter permease [Cohnella phaseoli]RED57463.1 carbohydrate ABC transporter membrane protein 2 (CUT1 family) [Cohnella phaseoli]
MSERAANRLRHVFLILLCLVLLVPFYIAVVNAFKPKDAIVSDPMGIPFAKLTLRNFAEAAFTPTFNIFKAYGTTALITIASIVCLVALGSMMSYVLARTKHRFFTFAYLLLLGGMMIPPQVILIPIIKLLRALGLMFSESGLILYNTGWYIPFTAFIYTGFIRTISKELDESAMMEGANGFQIFWRIIFPILKPPTASVVIFLFLFVWNDFLNPLVLLGSTKGYTVTTGIYMAVGQYSTNWDKIFALVVLASLPVLIVFLFLQRYFVSGLADGAVKG